MGNEISWLNIALLGTLAGYLAYLFVQLRWKRDVDMRKTAWRQKQSETLLPIRIQAYERMILFLERIAPHQLLLRNIEAGMTAMDLQRILLSEIRNEFNHNTTQQLYLSEPTWAAIKEAKEQIITCINETASEAAELSGVDLSKKILMRMVDNKYNGIENALRLLKAEFNALT